MRKKILSALITFLLFSNVVLAKPNLSDTSAVKVAVLLPMHLDSLFKYGQYRYKNTIPKFALPGLEFYSGVQMAVDALNSEGVNARVEVVDLYKFGALNTLYSFSNPNMPNLVIGVVQNAPELRQVSDKAKEFQIPFISASYPNDGGITNNPFLYITNSTLNVHVKSVAEKVKENSNAKTVVVFVRNGNRDARIQSFLDAAAKDMKKFEFKYVNLTDSFTVNSISQHLDSTNVNYVVGGSLDSRFGARIVKALSSVSASYTTRIFGMPTWDDQDFTKAEYKGVEVVYTTPFVSYTLNPQLYNTLNAEYKKVANSRPSDMFFRGYELTYRYVKNLAANKEKFVNKINEKDYKVFADFNFQPVSNGENKIDFYENDKVYFILKADGVFKSIL